MFKDLNKNNFNKSLNEDHETQNVWWNGEHNQEMKVEINKEKTQSEIKLEMKNSQGQTETTDISLPSK